MASFNGKTASHGEVENTAALVILLALASQVLLPTLMTFSFLIRFSKDE